MVSETPISISFLGVLELSFSKPVIGHLSSNTVFSFFTQKLKYPSTSVVALKYNLEKLGVTDKCTVLEGDNRIVCPKNVADR